MRNLPFFLFKIIIILLLTPTVKCKRPSAQLIFTKATYYGNPEYLSQFSIQILPKAPGPELNMNMQVLQNVSQDYMMQINVTRKERNADYRSIFAFDFDVCSVFRDKEAKNILDLNVGNVLDIWTNNIKKYGSMPTCPLVEGHYGIRNLRADRKSIPPFIASGKYRLDSNGYFKNTNPKVVYFNNSLFMTIVRK